MLPKPLYDITKSFEYNLEQGPFFDGVIPERIVPPRGSWHKIFDYEVMSPIGLAACPIGAHARGIELVSRLGFDVITHKTIRSHFSPAHPWPNVAVVERFPLSITNSIGNASMELEWHCREIAKARKVLLPGQILIVSIFGTEQENRAVEQDFCYIAQRAIEAGAHVIELNFSCPNVDHGILYHDVALSQNIVREVVKIARHIPVTVKVGLHGLTMRNFLMAIARAGACGIAGINSIPGRVLNDAGEPYFGAGREVSGISGAPIFAQASEWVRAVAEINAQEKLGLTIFGMGGITQSEQFDIFLNSGASVALTATGAIWDPYLANNYLRSKLHETTIQSNNSRRTSHPAC